MYTACVYSIPADCSLVAHELVRRKSAYLRKLVAHPVAWGLYLGVMIANGIISKSSKGYLRLRRRTKVANHFKYVLQRLLSAQTKWHDSVEWTSTQSGDEGS